MFARLFCWIMASALLISAPRALAEDGYDLWLRNAPADAAADPAAKPSDGAPAAEPTKQ